MPEPAGTGLSRRSFLLRSAGLGLAVYGAGRLANLPAFETGVAQAQGAGPGTVLLNVFMDGGVDSLSRARPGRRSALPQAAADARGRATGARSPRTRASPGIRRRRRSPTCTPRARSPCCPRSATPNADQSHFTSRHFWEVGALDPHLRTGWLGRVLDRVGSPDNPLQGISLDGQLSPTLATARNPVAAVNKPEDVGFWTPGAWGPAEELAVPAFTGIGRALTGSADPAVAQAARAAAFAGGVRDALAPLGKDGKPAYTPAAAYPQTRRRSRSGSPASPRCSPPACRSAPPSIRAPGAYDTHANQAESLPKNLKLTFDSLLAFQRDLEARGLADRVLTSCGRSSAAARPRTARAPTTARPASAS